MIRGEHPLAAGALGVMFTAESIGQIAAGFKTQTRRLFTRGNSYVDGLHQSREVWARLQFDNAWIDPGPSPAGNAGPYLKVPLNPPDGDGLPFPDSVTSTVHRVYPAYRPGEHWYIKESIGIGGAWAIDPCLNYRADGAQNPIDPKFLMDLWGQQRFRPRDGWRSPLLMPRWAARHFLEVTLVRIERLQAISVHDAWWEGSQPENIPRHAGDGSLDPKNAESDIIELYAKRWDRMHAIRGHGWDTNPWVIVYDFKRLTK